MQKETKRIIIIDANSVIHRAYHALPKLTTRSGETVNAVYGFLLVFFKAIKDFNPDFAVAAFDVKGPTYRHDKYKEYKAKRPKTPDDLSSQMPFVKEALSSFSVPIFEKQGFEADDIIGTISCLVSKKQVFPEIETIIVSGDADALQLVNSRTKVYILRKGVKDIVLYDDKLVKEKFGGLSPKQLLGYKALKGDPSDNIPGVTGIGEKTAISLLLEFGSLENIYKEIGANSKKAKALPQRARELLLRHKEQAFLSKELAEIQKNVPIDFNISEAKFGDFNKEKAAAFLNKLEFHSLIGKIPGAEKTSPPPVKENLKLW